MEFGGIGGASGSGQASRQRTEVIPAASNNAARNASRPVETAGTEVVVVEGTMARASRRVWVIPTKVTACVRTLIRPSEYWILPPFPPVTTLAHRVPVESAFIPFD